MKSGTQSLKMNNMGNNTNSNKFQKFDENQLNEAKASMKLLQTKMVNNNANSNVGGGMSNMGNNMNNLNNNNNYRKPFKPNFDNDDDLQIKIDSNINFQGGNSGMNRLGSKNQFGGGVGNTASKNTAGRVTNTNSSQRNHDIKGNNKITSNQKNNMNFNYEEPEDDRPAFAKTAVR
jgi:hypothetical protein